MDEYRECIDCKIPVLACKFHEHLKSKSHRANRMASRWECGVTISRLPLGITDDFLMEVLQKYGRVRSCSSNPYTGIANVEFEFREAAEAFLRSTVTIYNQVIHSEPRSDGGKQKRIIRPEAGVDNAAVIAAVEKACELPYTNIEEHIGIVLDFINVSDPTRDDKIATIVDDLEDHLSKILPDCRAELFGSAVTGLTLPGDPIDLSICDGPRRRSVSLMRSTECAFHICKLLLTLQYKFSNLNEIPDPRGPKMRFVHNSTRISCNFVINDTVGPRSSRKLRWVLGIDERIRLVVIFIKFWAKSLKIIDDEKFSGYIMTILVLFYLQQIPEAMVPALRLINDKNFRDMAENVTNRDPLRTLIEGFFSYYGHMRVAGQSVLSPYMGELLGRDIFILGGTAIPPAMQLYNRIVHSGARPLRVDSPMVLQDPYELNLNLTYRINLDTVTEFHAYCKQAYDMVKGGNLLPLLKAHCAHQIAPSPVPAQASTMAPTMVPAMAPTMVPEMAPTMVPAMAPAHAPVPPGPPARRPAPAAAPAAFAQWSPEINTSFKAARFLQPNYLVPEPKNEVVLSKKELFQRWLNVMLVILPDFLTNFVRLQLVPQEVPAEQNFWEPRAKVPKLSGKGNASRWNAPSKTGTDGEIRRIWLCRGRPVVCSWQQRKKAAAELELAPSIHPMEREVLISKHLEEQSFQSEEVSFNFILKVDEEKELIRCYFENLDLKQEPFTTVAHALVSLLTLWVNNAFEVGFSLRCVTGVYIPGDMVIGASKDCGPYAPW